MAFSKNRKRAIGIIASYLLGLSSSSCEFKEHSYFEPKWCDNCKHVYHKGDKSTCSHEKVNASFDDLYLQSNFVGEDGLLWFKNKKDPDKIFYIILRNKNGSKINSNLDKAYENYDFTILPKKQLEKDLQNEHSKLLLESFNNAENKQGGYIDWSDKLQDNPLDNVGAYLSNGGFVRNMIRRKDQKPVCQWKVEKTCNGNTGTKLMLAHESYDGRTYDVLETRYNRDTRRIESKDRTGKQSDQFKMREGGMIFFSIDDCNLPSQYANGQQHYICPLTRFPIVLIEPDKGLWLKKYTDDLLNGKDLKLSILIADGKTANGFVNSIGWNLLIEKYGTSQGPEVLIPCRLYANDFNARKWTNKRNNPLTVQP